MRATSAAGAAATVAWAGPALAPHVVPVCRALGIARTVEAPAGSVLLTFDDGPHREGTPAILRELDRAGARAVFFLVAEQVARDPGLAREIAAAGHELAVHGELHRCTTFVTPHALARDLDRAGERIGAVAATPLRLYRPPFGVFSPAALHGCRRRGWAPLLWSAWGRDWRAGATAASVAALVLRDVRDGGVVLLHDADHYSATGSWRATAGAVPRILEGLARRGLTPADPRAARPRR